MALVSPSLQVNTESVIAGELMTGAGGEGEHLAVRTCTHILDQSSQIRFIQTLSAFGVIADGPLNISNGQRPERGLRYGRNGRVGHIPHGPDVEGEVVTDDGSLHPDIGHNGVRGILDCVGRIE